MTDRSERVHAALEQALGSSVSPLRPTRGGDASSAALTSVAGEPVFVKWNDAALPRQFESEAKGLEALRRAAGGALVVPRVIAWSDRPGESFLALEHLAAGRRRADFDERLGAGLARIHRATDPRGFGFEVDGCCGLTPQPNGFLPRWVDFWRERRLLHQARLARGNGLEREGVAVLEQLAARLESILPADDEAPALIHGDLWAGNVVVAGDGSPALVDPAAYFADREAEFGMMRLFGGFAPRVYEAYDAELPRRDGHRERLDLYRLHHVINHFNLFGGGYGGQAVAIARRYVR